MFYFASLLLFSFSVFAFKRASLFFCSIASAATTTLRTAPAAQTTRTAKAAGTTRTTHAAKATRSTRTTGTAKGEHNYYN